MRYMTNQPRVTRLSLDRHKAVEAIDFVAREWPGVTQYYLCKIMYFADKEHCLDWGRTITGDRYVAMDHGPVPSRVYEMLKFASGEEDEILDLLDERVHFELEGNKIHVWSKNISDLSSLASSDYECLKKAVAFCRQLSFGQLEHVAHQELAWRRAAESHPLINNPPMNFADWFEAENMDIKKSLCELVQNSLHAVPSA
jgi:uncharacterized phage-associated protein